LAVGLSMEALSRGISVYFTTLTRMVEDLKKAYENNHNLWWRVWRYIRLQSCSR